MTKKTNSNILAIGGLNSGKSDSLLKPNMLEMDTSFIVSDPREELLTSIGPMLLRAGYKIKTFSLNKPGYSSHYNPLDYVYDINGNYSDEKAMILAYTYVRNIGMGNSAMGPLRINATIGLIMTAVEFLSVLKGPGKMDLNSLLKLLQKWTSFPDISGIVGRIKERYPDIPCISRLEQLKVIPNEIFSSVIEEIIQNLSNLLKYKETSMLLASVNDDEDEALYSTSNVEIEQIGCMKTALFIDTDTTEPVYKWINSLLFAQCYDILIDAGEKYCNKWFVSYDGMPISCVFDSEDDAEEYRKMYASATLDLDNNGMACLKSEDRCIEYMYSKEACERMVNEYKNATVTQNGDRKLPISVRFMLKNADRIGIIPNINDYISMSKYYGISTILTARSSNGLINLYGDEMNKLVNNCKYVMYFGNADKETCEFFESIIKNGGLEQTDFIIPDNMPGNMNIIIDKRTEPYSVRYEPKYDYKRHPNFRRYAGNNDSAKGDGNINAS